MNNKPNQKQFEYIDKEEKDIIESVNRGEWRSLEGKQLVDMLKKIDLAILGYARKWGINSLQTNREKYKNQKQAI